MSSPLQKLLFCKKDLLKEDSFLIFKTVSQLVKNESVVSTDNKAWSLPVAHLTYSLGVSLLIKIIALGVQNAINKQKYASVTLEMVAKERDERR